MAEGESSDSAKKSTSTARLAALKKIFQEIDEDLEGEDREEMPDDLIKSYYSPLTNLFNLVLYNEAYALKSPKTFIAVNVANLKPKTLVFLTRTLIINRVIDLSSLLVIL